MRSEIRVSVRATLLGRITVPRPTIPSPCSETSFARFRRTRLEGRVSLPRGASSLEAFVARQEARKAEGVAWPTSQSPIGVVKRNHALNFASRIKNAYLAYEVERGFPHSRLPDPSAGTRVQRRATQKRTSPTCEALLQ